MAKAELPKKGKYWTSDPAEELSIQVGESGPAALPPMTVMQVFKNAVDQWGDENALNVKREGEWKTWTWKQYYADTIRVAKAMLSLGVTSKDGINIIGFNSPEWIIANMGGVAVGAIIAPIYTTNGPEAAHYIADHSDGAIAFVENEMQCKKFLQIRSKLPKLKAIVQWSGVVGKEENVYSWEDFMKLGDNVDDSEVQKRIDQLKPSKCCTLIYTSGTTGPPKAVMLSHDNITWTARAVSSTDCIGCQFGDRLISYLPLSHVAAQMIDIHSPMAYGGRLFFAQPDALKGSLVETLKEVRPTLFLGVPRVWEKIQEKMKEVGKGITGMKRYIADWAKSIALAGAYADQDGTPKPWGFWASDYFILSKVKAALGLDQARLCASAAAPISKETLEYFFSLNIPIYEIYGMSECSGPQTVALPGAFRIGATGRSINGTELKIDRPNEEGHGEICYRGRHIFMGYMKDAKSTSETIDEEGWLHSGDIGIVRDGFLSITGRIKELIITAGGENIPPVLIEDEIMKHVGSVVSNVIIIGDRKKFLSCLVTLKAKPISNPKPGEYPFSNEVADSVKEAVGDNSIVTIEDAIKSEAVRKFIHSGIEKANKVATSNAQKVQKFEILLKDFSIETGELTPTMKLKRRIVVQDNASLIDSMYQGGTD